MYRGCKIKLENTQFHRNGSISGTKEFCIRRNHIWHTFTAHVKASLPQPLKQLCFPQQPPAPTTVTCGVLSYPVACHPHSCCFFFFLSTLHFPHLPICISITTFLLHVEKKKKKPWLDLWSQSLLFQVLSLSHICQEELNLRKPAPQFPLKFRLVSNFTESLLELPVK